MTQPDLDKVTLVMKQSGREFSHWTSVTISDDFLSPCQSMTLDIGVDETRFALTKEIKAGDPFTVLVNDAPQVTGYIDSCEVHYGGHEGTGITVSGRDGLSRLVDSNVDPRMAVRPKMGLSDVAQMLLVDQFALQFAIKETNKESRDLALGKPIPAKQTKRRRSLKDPLKDVRPHPNEGAFGYFCRLAHRIGYHLWAGVDGLHCVISGPEYDQSPAYDFTNTIGSGLATIGNNIERGRAKRDDTHIPSHVWVMGKDSKPGEKAKMTGFFDNSKNIRVFKPFFLKDDESSSKEHCDAVAAYMVGKAMRDYLTYEITVRGHSGNGRIYTVDTIATVKDEKAGIDGKMWVEGRMLRKSRGSGTTTDLKMLPADALILDYLVADQPPAPLADYKAGAAAIKSKPQEARLLFEEKYAASWFDGSYVKGKK